MSLNRTLMRTGLLGASFVMIVFVANYVCFGDLRSISDCCRLRTHSILSSDVQPDQVVSFDPDVGQVRNLLIRNLSLTPMKLYGMNENCDVRALSHPVATVGPLCQLRLPIWVKAKEGRNVVRVFHTFSEGPEYVEVSSSSE
jgi:hypothetical protein